MSDSQTQFATAGSRRSAASTKLTHGSLFSGVGGFDLGFGWAGIETAWLVENDPFARQVLEKRFPGVTKFTDVRDCGKHNLERVDIISGGFPCQDESGSGKKRGLGTPEEPTERSGLWYQQHRIIRELRPPWALIENVYGLLRSGDIDIVLSGMEEIGYTCWSLLLAAENLGAPHVRKRIWILCHRNDAHDSRDFKELMTEQWALPLNCQQEMGRAKERWDYWRAELSSGGFSPLISTPTRTEILMAEWDAEHFCQTDKGRMRKQCKTGTEGSMSWAQEMAARAVKQGNPRLEPTPEACEEMMGYPASYSDLGQKEPEAVAYARIRQGVYGIPDWAERLKALGNAVVPQFPMLFGCFIQQFESQFALQSHTGSHGSKEDRMSENLSAQDTPRPENGENISPVGVGYESLDVEETKKAYEELDAALGELTSTVVQTIEQIVPYLDRMQSLLSQRGANRKKVLKKAGLPRWTQWAESYARNLHCTVRTIQLHIKVLRNGREFESSAHAAATEKRSKGSGASKPVRLDGRQQAALVKAQLAANDLADALRNGADWQTPLAEYQKVAIAPAKLDNFLNALSPEPDWKSLLKQLVNTLEQCSDKLPIPVTNALHAVQKLVNGKSDQQKFPSGKPQASAAPAPKHGRGEKSQKLIPSPKDTVHPPVLSAEQEERKQGTLEPASGRPVSRQGDFVHNEEGKWEYAPEEQQAGDMTQIRNVQLGDLPHSKRLSASPVASIVPRQINPQPTAQSAA